MKILVRTLAAAVRRLPWVVIAVALVATFVLGAFSSKFQPSENDSEGFAPDAPELAAADRIGELFGSDSSQSVMQVVISSESGDVITMDGFSSVQSIRETVMSGSLGPWLVDQPAAGGPVLHYLAPVEFAIVEGGAPPPTNDAMVKEMYEQALAQLPPEQAGFAAGLLPANADQQAVTSTSGLLLIFTTGPATTAEFDEFAEASAAAAAEISEAVYPEGVSADPFSFELLFAGDDEFQAEIGRIFATAGFIILLVLSLIFLVKPRTGRDRWMQIVGVLAMLAAVGILVLPSLATLFPDLFPEAIRDLEVGPLLGIAALIYAFVYLMWTFSSRGLRRTTADTLVTVLAIGMAVTWMNGYGYLRFGEAGQMTQIIPILLIGLGVDYSIHMGSRYREEVSAGRTVDASIEAAIRTVGIALILATVTTAVGFMTNLVNEIPALREFGELAAVGIVASFILMLTFVPAVRELLDRRGERKGTFEPSSLDSAENKRLPRLIGKASWLPKHAATATLIVTLIFGGLGAFGTSRLEAGFSFLDFIPTTSPLRSTFQTLLDDYGGGFGETTQILIEGDTATPSAWNAMVESTANMADTEYVTLFGDQAAAESPVSLFFELASQESPRFDMSVGLAAQVAGMSPGVALVSDGADMTALYDAMFAAAPEDAGRVLTADYQAALFTIQTHAGEEGAAQLREDLAVDFKPVTDAGLSAVATSDEIISAVIIQTLQDSQLSSLLLTLAAALVLLVANFWFEVRRPLLGVITTVPVVLVVLWSFALMTLFGIPFGPVTATISALAIGIGIPYMIHVTHRYEEDRVRTDSENDAIEQTLVHTGGALGGSAITTVAGFGILVTSSTIPFRQFGFVTAYTILLALIAAVLVLPSMLVLWDRWHRSRGEDPIARQTAETAAAENG